MRLPQIALLLSVSAACVGLACSSFSEDDPSSAGGNDAGDIEGRLDGSATNHDSSFADSSRPCTDLQNESKNCGACGHDCLGGKCAKGKCEPVTLATSTAPIASLAVNDTRVAWVVGTGTEVSSCPLTGCTPDRVFAGGFVNTTLIARYGTGFAVASVPSAVMASLTSVTDLGAKKSIEDFDQIDTLTSDGAAAIYVVGSRSGSRGFHRYDAVSGGSSELLQDDTAADVIGAATNAFLYSGSLVNKLRVCTLMSGNACSNARDLVTIAAAGGKEQLATAKDTLFWIQPTIGTLSSIGATAEPDNEQVLYTSVTPKLTSVAADDDFVYIAHAQGITRCLHGGCAGSVSLVSGPPAHSLVLTKNAIYWATDDFMSGTTKIPAGVWRLAK